MTNLRTLAQHRFWHPTVMLPTLVFVIDDEPPVLKLSSLALRMGGYEVRSFESAPVALDALASVDEADPAVIVLDLKMPEMDGPAFFREARAAGHTMPVLLVSAWGATQAREELGAEDALAKPFNPDDLVERVDALVQQRTMAAVAS